MRGTLALPGRRGSQALPDSGSRFSLIN